MSHNECVIVGLCPDNEKKLRPLGPLCLQVDVETDRKNKEIRKANMLLPDEVTLISIPYLSGSALSAGA